MGDRLTPAADQLAVVFARAERRRRRAAHAEQAAFRRWCQAYSDHENARDTAAAALANWQAARRR
jgi:hypothetical protein